MRVNNTSSSSEKEKKKKKRENQLEAMVFQIMEQSLKKALDAAIDDILGEWK